MHEPSPFATPGADLRREPAPPNEIGPIKATFGIVLCVYSVGLIGFATYGALVTAKVEVFDLALIIPMYVAGGGGLVAGWRLGGRRPAGPWIWVPVAVHVLGFIAGVIATALR